MHSMRVMDRPLLTFYPPAPSAAPTSVRVSAVTSSNITVQWGAVDCIHHNGDITGYSVWYGVQGSGTTQTRDVSGGDTRQTTIHGLNSSTTYAIQVAAVNSAGIGEYSDPPVIIKTLPRKYTNVLCICDLKCVSTLFLRTCSVYAACFT